MANKIQYQVDFKVQKQSLNQLKTSLQQLQKMKISDIMKINDSDARSAIIALTDIKTEAKNVENALKQAFNAKLNTVNIETFNQSLKASQSSIQQVYEKFKQAGTSGENAFRSLSSAVLNTNIQLKESHTILDKMATTLANTVKWNAASTVVNGLSRSVEQAWGYVKALDTSLNDIRIVTGKSADEMANFAVQANEAAKSLGKTTTDYTNAALIYAQQGLSDKEIEERTAITLKTANVTGQSTADVSEELTAVWNGYKVNAEQAELYVDRLAAVAATTASDLEELSTGMSKVASAAAAMGVGEEQLAAQLSTIISATRQAPESVGTALRTVYARISDIKAGIDEDGVTLGNYSGKMADLGFNVLDATGHLRDMGEVMEEIGGKWETLTREQQVNLAQTMAGQRQYNNLLALFDNFDKYNEALNTAQNAAGTLQEQQDIYMESIKAHLQVLKASVEDIYDSFADTDTINGLIDGLSSAAELVANLVDGLGGGGAVLRSLGAIGVTVFSEQIAKGLNTTITNLEIGKENARQFDQALQATKDWQGIPGLDKTSQDLLKNREQLLELARLMTPEQFSGMQTLLNDITQVGNEIAQLEDEQSFLNKAIEDVLKYSDSWQTVEEVMASDEGQAEVIKRLQQQEQGIQNVVKAINQYSKLQNTMNTKMINGESISSELEQAKQSIINYYNELEKLGSSGQLSERHIQSLENIKRELDTLDDAVDEPAMAAKIQLIVSELRGVATAAGQSATETRQKIESEMGAAADSIANKIAEKQAQLQSMVVQFVTGQERMQRAANIENYAKMAGGIAQVGSAIMQVQNLGSIWKNQDLTTGEKLLQTITNLAISLPMLATGFTKATTALGLMKTMTTAEAVVAGISTSAEAAHAVSIGLVGTASGAAAVKVQLLNTTLMLNPFVAVATAAIALATAIGMIAKAHDQAREAAIQQHQAEIDEENAKQQQISKNRQLYSSIEDLNEQYKNGEITRAELKSSVQDLIDQYRLQGNAAQALTNHYNDLSDAIDKARAKEDDEAVKSAQRAKDAAEQVLASTAEGKTFDNQHLNKDNKYSVTFAPGLDLTDEPQQIRKAFEDNGFTLIGNAYTATIDYSPQSMQDLYDKIQKILKSADNLSPGEALNSEWVQSLKDWSSEIGSVLDQVNDVNQKLNNAQVNQIGDQLINSEDIQTGNDYLRERAELINKINKELGNPENATELADTYLKDNLKDQFNQFDELTQYIDNIQEKFGKELPDSIKNILGSLNENQLAEFFSLPDSVLQNWNALPIILQKIANKKFDNIEQLKTYFDDLQSQIDAASEQYNTYQSLEDQVKSGKSISNKELQSLDPELQQYFDRMANGTYKMTGDAQEFYNLINNLKLDGFKETLADIENAQQTVKDLQEGKFDYQGLNKEAFVQNTGNQKFADEDLVGQQLDYLQALESLGVASVDVDDTWRQLLETHKLDEQTVKAIAAEVEKVGNQTDNLKEKDAELTQMAEQLAHQMHDAMFPTDEDVDSEALQALSETIQGIADQSTELADSLQEDGRAAEDVAESILRFDDAIQDVTKNYDDWMAALNSGSLQDQAEAVAGLRDAYADLLDLDGTSLSEDFLTNADNLQLMKEAANGSEDAYNRLMQIAQQDIATQVGLDTSQFDAAFDNLMDQYYQGQNLDDMEIGASLNNQGFLDGLTQMVNAAGMTAQQATDYLASMGVDAEVIEQDNQAQENSEAIEYHTTLTPNTQTVTDTVLSNSGGMLTGATVDQSVTSWDQNVEAVPVPSTAKKESKNFSLKVTSAHKSSGGGFKFSQAKNGGGSGGSKKSSGGGKKGGGGGKKGGSGKSAQPDTSQKDLKKSLKDERDIYHDINIELEQVNRTLDRVQKQQDRLYGKQLIDNLNKQSKILEQHKTILREKQDLQKQDLKQQQQSLKNLGVMFDQYGNITNYMDILGHKQTEINGLINQENSLIQAYNRVTDKDIKKQISDQIEAQEKRVKAAQEEYKDLQDRIKNYDKLRESMEDVIDQIEEETQKQIEINIKKFRMEVEIRLEMGQAERDWNRFRRQVLEHTDVIKDSDFQNIFSNTMQNSRDLESYFNVHGSIGSLQALTNQLMATRAEIDSINKTGTSAIYGDNKAQAMEDLQNDLKELMNQMEDVQKLIDDIDKAYLDTIDDIEDQFDKQIEDYEYVQDLIEHDIDLLQLLYGDKNYSAMVKYYDTLTRNNLNQLDSLKKQRDFWKEQWDAAVARGDTNAAKQFEENYKKTIKNLNQTIENAAKTIQEKYVNAIDKIFDELDKKISNGKGTDYLSTQWELMNKNADEYLDTINTAFALQETESKYQKALDDTKSIKNQQALKNLMNEQLDILKNKEKVTQYDIDRAQKLLQVEQARIALEDAQSAKTTLRLKRDSQGNYSYQYMADNGAIDDAKDNLAQAQNDLYNFDLDRYKQNLNDMLSAWRDFQQEYKEILEDTSLSDEDRMQRLALLREQYGEYINNKTEENVIIRNNLRESAFKDIAALYNTDVANYKQMSLDEQNILMGDLVPAWNSGIQQMSDKVAGEGGFIPTCEDAFEDIKEETQAYKEELQDLADAAGVNLNDIQNGVDLLAQAFEYLVEKNDDLIDRMNSQMFAIEALRDQARALVNDYNDVYNSAANAVIQLHQFVQAEQAAAAAYKGTADAYENMVVRMQRANQAYASNPYGGFAPSSNSYSTPSGGGSSSSGGGSGSSGSGYSNRSNSSSSSSSFKSTGQRISDYWKTHKGSSSSGRSYGASGGCFVAGTKILMSDKTSKNIEDVNINDIVYAYNQKEKKYEHKKVTNVFVHVYAEGQLVKVTFSNNMVLQMTLGHPVLTTTGWKSFDAEASMQDHNVKTTMLKLGDEVITINGNIIVKKIEFIPYVNTFKVYNIEVEGCHTYLANEVVVHNKYNRFATGGYTGEWGSEAKWALLDEKELVLNRQDTQNILDSVKLMRSIINSLNISTSSRLSDLSSPYQRLMNNSKEQIEQNVHIEASFPNVDSKRQIEEAFNDLVNLAAQRAMRR